MLKAQLLNRFTGDCHCRDNGPVRNIRHVFGFVCVSVFDVKENHQIGISGLLFTNSYIGYGKGYENSQSFLFIAFEDMDFMLSIKIQIRWRIGWFDFVFGILSPYGIREEQLHISKQTEHSTQAHSNRLCVNRHRKMR